jgi:hypothetical protein
MKWRKPGFKSCFRFKWVNLCRYGAFEYEQLNRIDEGTYGVVFRARDKKTGVVGPLYKGPLYKLPERS